MSLMIFFPKGLHYRCACSIISWLCIKDAQTRRKCTAPPVRNQILNKFLSPGEEYRIEDILPKVIGKLYLNTGKLWHEDCRFFILINKGVFDKDTASDLVPQVMKIVSVKKQKSNGFYGCAFFIILNILKKVYAIHGKQRPGGLTKYTCAWKSFWGHTNEYNTYSSNLTYLRFT